MVNLTFEIISLRDVDADEWNSFVASTSEGSFFCTTDWWYTFDNPLVLVVLNTRKEIIAGIPFRLVKVLPLIGKYFQLGWTDSSPLVRTNLGESDVIYLKSFVINALVSFLDKKAIILMISSKTRSKDAALLGSLGFNIEKCATLILDLNCHDSQIWKSFSKGNKSSINKGRIAGVQVKINEGRSAIRHISDYCQLEMKMFEAKKGVYSDIYYKSESYLENILQMKYNRVFLAMAYYNGLPTAGALLVAYRDEIYYYLGASDPAISRISQAAHYLQYEIIKFAKSEGFLRYDFGNIPFNPVSGHPEYGVYVFKKGFGGIRYEFDQGDLVLNRFRYRIVWKLRRLENNPVFVYIYNLLKR